MSTDDPDAPLSPRRPEADRHADGSELAPATKPKPDGTLVKALARAWRGQRLLDGGGYATIAELGSAEHISCSYVCRILRLTLLAPDIAERILDGSRTVTSAGL